MSNKFYSVKDFGNSDGIDIVTQSKNLQKFGLRCGSPWIAHQAC